MARISLLLSLLSLALLTSAAHIDSRSAAAHNKRCKPKSHTTTSSSSTSSSLSTTSSAPPPPPTTTSTPPPAPTTTSDPPPPAPTTSSDPPPPATTSAAPATAPPPSGGNKCGLGWPNGDDGTINSMAGQCTWYHDWSVYPVTTNQLQFATMLWGPAQQGDFDAHVLSSGTTTAMFYNEPQEPLQSNVDPWTAAADWQTHMEPLKQQHGFRLGSAATSSNPNGMTWMQNFFTACNGACTVDFMCLHWYGTTVQDFQDYVTLWWTTFNKPIWITEFACQNFVNLDQQCDDIPDFVSQATAWLDAQPFVERHAYFGMMRDLQNVNPANALMSTTGQLTSLGYEYIYST